MEPICNEYSNTCVTPTPLVGTPKPAPAGPDFLPFTGAELILLTAAAICVILTGLALLITGTRRGTLRP